MKVREKENSLLAGIIDYAGLFPPAQLNLQDSLENYLNYRNSPHAWLLGHFLCPVNQLDALDALLKEKKQSIPANFIATPNTNLDSYMINFERDLQLIERYISVQSDAKVKCSFETKIPRIDQDHFEYLLSLYKLIEIHSHLNLNLFVEVTEEILFQTPQYMIAMRKVKDQLKNPCEGGIKLRCGGTMLTDIPQVDFLVETLLHAKQLNLPVKFTAGLHHPLRYYDQENGSISHGFINLFAASILSRTEDLEAKTLCEILQSSNASDFSVEDGIRYKSFHAKAADVQKLRKTCFPSFGSCSFQEPCEDLKELGWLL